MAPGDRAGPLMGSSGPGVCTPPRSGVGRMAIALPRAEPLLPTLTLTEWCNHPSAGGRCPLWIIFDGSGEMLTGNLLWPEAVRWAHHYLEWYRQVVTTTDGVPEDLWYPYTGPLVST